MSRTYIANIGFEKNYPKKKIKEFFIKWCGKEQIYKVYNNLIICEMGCSGGVPPEDALNCLYTQLKEAGFDVKEEEIMCWSLHPDRAVYAGYEEDLP